MKNSPFTKKTRHMLEDNGYSAKSDDGTFTFKHSSSAIVGVIIVVIIAALFNIFFIVVNPIPGIIAFVMLIIATITVAKKLVGKTLIMIKSEDKTFSLNTPSYSCNWTPATDVSEIILKSKYVDEYTSAFKSTSEEHLITIDVRLASNRIVQLFKFSSDYAEPSTEINEVYSFLEKQLKHSV